MANILHVDDEDQIRKMVPRMLPNHTVTSAANMGEALAIIAAAPKPFDLIITDYDLKDGSNNGLALLAAPPGTHWMTPAIVCSSHGMQDISNDPNFATVQGQIQDVVTKPFRQTELAKAVNSALYPSGPGAAAAP